MHHNGRALTHADERQERLLEGSPFSVLAASSLARFPCSIVFYLP